MGSILSVRQLNIQISSRFIIQNVSFDIFPGEAVLLSGENGIGKSTLLKSILRIEESGRAFSGSINYQGFGNILNISDDELQKYRSSIAYIGQKDEYSEMGNVRVCDIISDSNEAFSGIKLSASEVNSLIDEWIPKRNNNRRVFDATTKPRVMSGGEQRLLSVLSVIATRPKSSLMIIDEPLNNLDFENARSISNIINRVIKQNPQMGLLMISHCRIFPFITREIQLTPNGIIEVTDSYSCHSCFGSPDRNGFYS